METRTAQDVLLKKRGTVLPDKRFRLLLDRLKGVIDPATLTYLGAKVLTASLGLLALVVITRLLNPTVYGEYVILFSVFVMVNGVFTYWVPASVFRHFRQLVAIRHSMRRVLLYGVMPSVVLVLFSLWVASVSGYFQVDKIDLALLSVLSLGITLFGVNSQSMVANNESGRYSLVVGVRSASYLIFLLLFLSVSASPASILAALAASYLAGTVVYYLGKGRSVSLDDTVGSDVPIRSLLKYGAPLTIAYLSSQALIYSDRWVLATVKGPDYAGSYSASLELVVFMVTGGFMAMNMSHYPAVMRAYDSGSDEVKDMLHDILPKYGIYLIFLYVFFFYFAPYGLPMLLGQEYRSDLVDNHMYYLAIGVLQSMNMFYFNYTYQLSKRVSLQALLYLSMALLNLVLCYFLVAGLGTRGAALSTIAALLAGMLVTASLSKRIIGVGLLQLVFKVVVGPMIIVVACILVNPVIGLLAAFSALYWLSRHVSTNA